jgi:hypothetical protein
MPEYAIVLYAPIDDLRPSADSAAERAEHERHSQELQDEGRMIAAFALESFQTATSIRAGGISDGPFIESKEVVLGFCIVEATDLDDALALARRNPIIHQGGGVEVRPVEGSVVRPPSSE